MKSLLDIQGYIVVVIFLSLLWLFVSKSRKSIRAFLNGVNLVVLTLGLIRVFGLLLVELGVFSLDLSFLYPLGMQYTLVAGLVFWVLVVAEAIIFFMFWDKENREKVSLAWGLALLLLGEWIVPFLLTKPIPDFMPIVFPVEATALMLMGGVGMWLWKRKSK